MTLDSRLGVRQPRYASMRSGANRGLTRFSFSCPVLQGACGRAPPRAGRGRGRPRCHDFASGGSGRCSRSSRFAPERPSPSTGSSRTWGAEALRTALASLHNAVSQLRKLLGPEIVVTRDPGYAVDGDVTVDTARFEHLLTEARAARSMRDEETAAAILREALGLGSRRLRAGRAPNRAGADPG